MRLGVVDETKNRTTSDYLSNPPYFLLVKPVVIFDGPLLSAELSEGGDIQLEEITAAPVTLSYKTKHYTREDYQIDVVSMDYFSDYLTLSIKRHDNIYRHILNACDITEHEI